MLNDTGGINRSGVGLPRHSENLIDISPNPERNPSVRFGSNSQTRTLNQRSVQVGSGSDRGSGTEHPHHYMSKTRE